MTLKAGVRLSTPESACEVLVVKPAKVPGVLTCAGGEMTSDAKNAGPQHGTVDIQLGKRYTDEPSGLEVLCVKPGRGPLRFADRDLVIRAAKPLPASD